MHIDISSRTFGRLAKIVETVPKTDKRHWLRSVFYERTNGHEWIGATNSMFAAIYYLGLSQNMENGFVTIKASLPVNPMSDDVLSIDDFSLMDWSNAKIAGVDHPNCVIRDIEANNTFKNWRMWIPEEISEKPGRAMFIDTDYLLPLVQCSPSGSIVFPKAIDAEKPVLVRDVVDSHWLGIFLARPHSGIFLDGATRPEWSL